MGKLTLLLFTLVIAAVLISPKIAFSATQDEIVSSINKEITPNLDPQAIQVINQSSSGNWSSIDSYSIGFELNSTKAANLFISYFGNTTWIPIIVDGVVVNATIPVPPIVNQTEPPIINETNPEPQIEICGDGIDNNNNNEVDEGCPITPPITIDTPTKDVNTTQTLRVCSVADIDNNNGLVTQLNLAHDYNCRVMIIPGDFEYTDGPAVITKLSDQGFTQKNTALINGNHDKCSDVKSFTKMAQCYGIFVLDDDLITGINAYLGIFSIDANQDFKCGSTQFNALKAEMESDEAWYHIAVVHQPFVTVKSDHGPNGQFDCYDPVFRGNGVNVVLQGHNHNYQRFDINGLEYFVTGTGTHDTGSSMYPIGSDNWNNFDCLKCDTGTNGVTFIDFKIDDSHQREAHGWFLSNSGNVVDKFSLMD